MQRTRLTLLLPLIGALLLPLALVPGCRSRRHRLNSELNAYTIAGLPQHFFYLDTTYPNGTVTPIRWPGTLGYVISPSGKVDAERRWVWISPMWLTLRADPRTGGGTGGGTVTHRFYVESFLAAGFHVAGLDVGTTCGSPAGADLYERFYNEILIGQYKLNPKARMIGQSNGGLISYAWAFRHPEHVDRVVGLAPATDLRSWPGLDRAAGPSPITPAGLAYPMDKDQLQARLGEFNPIDNLAPMVKAGIKVLHVHGDKDNTVPIGPNSEEFVRRYRELGGTADLEVIKGLGHGGQPLYTSRRALDFLLAP
jgi:pimeloyl-ACP methyl ester carboxylesterase